MSLISINAAIDQRIERIRKPIWVNDMDHIKIDLMSDGGAGPWLHLYCPFNKECNGRDPMDILRFNEDCEAKMFEPYTGPLPESEEYKTAQAKFEGVLK